VEARYTASRAGLFQSDLTSKIVILKLPILLT
jgi:hypothetical protein